MFIFHYIIIIIDEKRIWLILSQCLLGLAALKSFNIIHRDIKGENIFITADNSVKIGVFLYFFIILYVFLKEILVFLVNCH
jgi:serine/threonine protein kinase